MNIYQIKASTLIIFILSASYSLYGMQQEFELQKQRSNPIQKEQLGRVYSQGYGKQQHTQPRQVPMHLVGNPYSRFGQPGPNKELLSYFTPLQIKPSLHSGPWDDEEWRVYNPGWERGLWMNEQWRQRHPRWQEAPWLNPKDPWRIKNPDLAKEKPWMNPSWTGWKPYESH